MSDMEKIAERIKKLRELIEYHSNAYYNLDAPEIEDDEYDALMRELRGLEEQYPELKDENSPTVRVGGLASEKFASVEHTVAMQSLRDVFDRSEVEQFCADFPGAEFVVEKKIDGLSVSLEYTNGVLTRGSTRGDGHVGEDITENLMTIASIPHRIQTDAAFLEVRGEVYMPRRTFAALNQAQEENGLKTFKNPRNAAAGSLRQKDASITAARGLDIFVFNVQQAEGIAFETHSRSLEYLAACGFPVSPGYTVASDYHDVAAAIEKIGSQRGSLEYDIDGAVVKVNSLRLRQSAGVTSKFPKWAVAFKYPPEQKETILRDVEVTVGRTGVLTPTGVFDPVLLAGTSVSRASLHNQDYITQKDIRIGDTVVLRKAGEIIPEVVSVAVHGGGEPYLLPEVCPSCGEKVFRLEDEAALRCLNPDCPAQLLRNIIHFASRDAMDIEGMGPAVIEQLISAGKIKSPADIYELTEDDIASLERMGKKSAQNLISAIQRSKSNDLYRLIFALGIRHICAFILVRQNQKRYGVLPAAKQKGYFSVPADAIFFIQWSEGFVCHEKSLRSVVVMMPTAAAATAFIVVIVVMMRMLHVAVEGLLKGFVELNPLLQHGHLVVGVAGIEEGQHVLDNAAIALEVLRLGVVVLQSEQLVALHKAPLVVLLNKFRFRELLHVGAHLLQRVAGAGVVRGIIRGGGNLVAAMKGQHSFGNVHDGKLTDLFVAHGNSLPSVVMIPIPPRSSAPEP